MKLDTKKRQYHKPIFSASVKLVEITAQAVVSGIIPA